MTRRLAWAALVVVIGSLAWATRLGTRWPSIYVMTGSSMEPTVRAREYFLAWGPLAELRGGDLVIFVYEDEDGVFHVLRRLVGVPGDTVAMRGGAVLVNGVAASWPYRIINPAARQSLMAREHDLYDWGPWLVPADSVLLLADTRDMLGWPDSRFLGFIPRNRLVARATRTLHARRLQD